MRLAALWFVGTRFHCARAWFARGHWGICIHGPSMLAISVKSCMCLSSSHLSYPYSFRTSRLQASSKVQQSSGKRKASRVFNSGSQFCSSLFELQAKGRHMALQCLSVNMFRENITAVVMPGGFFKGEVALPQPVLYPHVRGRQVANLPQSSSLARTHTHT